MGNGSSQGWWAARRRAALAALALEMMLPHLAMSTSLESVDLGGAPSGGVGLNRNPGSTADMSPNGRFAISWPA